VRISATIADWEWLRQRYRQRADPDPPAGDGTRCRGDSFTRWNDSYIFNTAVGEAFAAVRGGLPTAVAGPIEEFLVTFCPAVAEGGRLVPPRDPEAWDEEVDYAALSPEEVRRRLGLLDRVDLPTFFARLHEHFAGCRDDPLAAQGEVVEFVFMWAAALGEAASKGWGMVVTLC
jgi:hypothetical protein